MITSHDERPCSDECLRYDGRVKIIILCAVLLIQAVGIARASQHVPPIREVAQPSQVKHDESAPESPHENSARVQNLLMHALSLIGVQYQFGGNSLAHGFDCSGLVRHVFAEALSVELPRSSFEMSKLGNPVDNGELQPGDLLFYNTRKQRFSHVALYLGEGRFVHAPSRGKTVEIVSMSEAYWKKRFDGARRLVETN